MDETPDWINNEFLEKALNSQEECSLKVLSSEITKATAPGDNYGSDIYRAVVQISRNGLREKKSLILKAELINIELKKVFSETHAFQTEIDAFTYAIPQLHTLLEESVPGKYQPLAAECYYIHSGSPSSVLVFEDLVESGFRLVNPSEGLDVNHCLLVVRTLGIYHAASVVLNHKSSHIIEEKFKQSIYNENSRNFVRAVFNPVLKNLLAEAKNWSECEGDIIKKLRNLKAKTFEYLVDSVNTDDSGFNVLAHEDVWLNNLMFRYSQNSSEVTDLRIVDFQTCQWTSPAIDLLYFINANAPVDIIKNPQSLIEEYFKKLSETLTVLGYGHLCLSKEQLYQQYEKRCKFGVILSLFIRFAIISEQNKSQDVIESYKKDIRQILCIFNEKDWL